MEPDKKGRHIPPDTESLKDFQWQFPDGMYSANGPKAKKSHLNQPQDKTVNCKHNQPEQTTPPQQSSAGNSMNDIVGGYENIKTTQIYTHLTNTLLDNIHNPASAFDLGGG